MADDRPLCKTIKMKVEVLIQANNLLGEGPVWDHRNNEFLWVGIENNTLNFYDTKTKETNSFTFDYRVGAAVPVVASTTYLVALQNGLVFFNRSDKSVEYISNCEAEITTNRFNDGKCDPAGRFWIGSMDLKATAGKGALYSLDTNLKLKRHLSDLSIPNGMAWSNGSKSMYFIDTATGTVVEFDYDLIKGSISNGKTIITIPENMGCPDGMCIDVEGMLWIANWGAACVSRWNPNTGKLLQKVDVPALNVSSVCFGGKNFDTLFITSARTGLTNNELDEYPLSGSVFTFNPQITGIKSSFFKRN